MMPRPSAIAGAVSDPLARSVTTDPLPDFQRVAGPNGLVGVIDRNSPPADWNGRTLPLLRVQDEEGTLIGFGCRFFTRDEVERDSFDADVYAPP